jgi:hypothetical protein
MPEMADVWPILTVAAWVLSVPLWLVALFYIHNGFAFVDGGSLVMGIGTGLPPVALIFSIGSWWFAPFSLIVLGEWIFFAYMLRLA